MPQYIETSMQDPLCDRCPNRHFVMMTTKDCDRCREIWTEMWWSGYQAKEYKNPPIGLMPKELTDELKALLSTT